MKAVQNNFYSENWHETSYFFCRSHLLNLFIPQSNVASQPCPVFWLLPVLGPSPSALSSLSFARWFWADLFFSLVREPRLNFRNLTRRRSFFFTYIECTYVMLRGDLYDINVVSDNISHCFSDIVIYLA